MKTKIFFAHSAGVQNGKGNGSFDLVNYLRNTLGRNYEVLFPIIKEPSNPNYYHWKTLLHKEFNKLNEPVILVGHSLGGSVLLKYLSEEECKLKIKGIFLVATPQWDKDGWNMPEWAVQKNFIDNLPMISSYYFYHCLNDPIVPFAHLSFYQKAFKNATFKALACKDHVFSDGLKELTEDIRMISNN